MKQNSVSSTLVVLSFLALPPARADEPLKKPDPVSASRGAILSIGGGFGMGGTSSQLAGIGSMQFRRGGRVFGLRIAGSTDFELFGATPANSTTDYSALYGIYRSKAHGYTTASIGVALVSTVGRGKSLGRNCDPTVLFGCLFATNRYEKVASRTAGIPFEAKAVLSSRFAGLGLSIFGNINPKSSYAAAAVTLDVGSLR